MKNDKGTCTRGIRGIKNRPFPKYIEKGLIQTEDNVNLSNEQFTCVIIIFIFYHEDVCTLGKSADIN